MTMANQQLVMVKPFSRYYSYDRHVLNKFSQKLLQRLVSHELTGYYFDFILTQ